MELFNSGGKESIPPLADRIRPDSLAEFAGQEELVNENKPLYKMIERKSLSSFLIYGPPGSGKTTIALIASKGWKRTFITATTAHIKDVRSMLLRFKKEKEFSKVQHVLIIDEIQHFTRREQDAFLSPVERGDIILIALTTENPSFYINSALLSRLSVFVFNRLAEDEIRLVVQGALTKDAIMAKKKLTEEALDRITVLADGDARRALNILESIVVNSEKNTVDLSDVENFLTNPLYYGKEHHYDLVSAFIKSMRGSNLDAALYYFYRMIDSGEDPRYIARRMIRFAAEDIGLKDPNALVIANATRDAFQNIGPPEGYLVLAEAVVYLAKADKCNELYLAENEVLKTIKETGNLEVPKKLRNPVTSLMKKWGYGKGYKYPHNYEGHKVENENYLPERIKGKKFYKED
ncbi:MAG: replication-associated recombination protein A [Caldisericota bacterium]|nr:replication-associated recombination protein A [Caldisericota bacterium]